MWLLPCFRWSFATQNSPSLKSARRLILSSSALGGLFAKQKLRYIIAAWTLLLCITGCNPDPGPVTPSAITYTVTFNANGGSGNAPAAMTVNEGQSITLPSAGNLSRSGYLFDGWNANASGTETTYQSGNSFTPSGTITFYAQWVTTYTVTFDLNGGWGTAPQRTVEPGYSIVIPDSGNIHWDDYATFTGWNTRPDGSGTNHTSPYTPTGNTARITLYAQWDVAPLSSVTGLYNKLRWLQAHAQSDTSYTVNVDNDETEFASFSFSNKSGITITLRGISANWTVSAYFYVNSGFTLVLDNNITLQSSVTVNSGGRLIMNNGSAISGNYYYVYSDNDGGGGVCVNNGGTFTMNGGEIRGNTISATSTSAYGGGVYVGERGTFTMNGGEISGNTISATSTIYTIDAYGGGVYVGEHGTFTMNGGEIRDNTATSDSDASGGGVCVSGESYTIGSRGGTFTMNGGKIRDNTATNTGTTATHYGRRGGGGVFVGSGAGGKGGASFTMNGGEIRDNTATATYYTRGGGVFVYDGDFTMKGGTISGNTGDGVFMGSFGRSYARAGTFTMNGGTISDNTGEGVSTKTFTMSNGTISGNTGGGVSTETFTMSNGTISGNTGTGVSAGTFTMNGGTISGNTSRGVYVTTFTMSNGTISGNTGGGVSAGTFTMSGGEISGNTAEWYGGGVCVERGTFTKTSGIITGYASDTVNGNVVKDDTGTVVNDSGHAVYVSAYSKRRETTAGPSDNLDSSVAGTAGGWEY